VALPQAARDLESNNEVPGHARLDKPTGTEGMKKTQALWSKKQWTSAKGEQSFPMRASNFQSMVHRGGEQKGTLESSLGAVSLEDSLQKCRWESALQPSSGSRVPDVSTGTALPLGDLKIFDSKLP